MMINKNDAHLIPVISNFIDLYFGKGFCFENGDGTTFIDHTVIMDFSFRLLEEINKDKEKENTK